MPAKAVRVTITGKVQGVGYRAAEGDPWSFIPKPPMAATGNQVANLAT